MALVQQQGALKIASSCRTASEPAVPVIIGVTLIDLLAQEEKRVYETREEVGAKQARTDAKALTRQGWQEH